MTLTLVKQAVVVALYVLGVPINTHKDLYHPASHRSIRGKVRDRIGPGAWGVPATLDKSLHTYLYRFEGIATFKGKTIQGAKVILHVTTSRLNQTQVMKTDQDGAYHFTLQVEGTQTEPVDWEMHAYTPDMNHVVLVGRRIAMEEDTTVTVHNTLFLVSPQA